MQSCGFLGLGWGAVDDREEWRHYRQCEVKQGGREEVFRLEGGICRIKRQFRRLFDRTSYLYLVSSFPNFSCRLAVLSD
jgi:hypothetical protein